ncbi:hypothetical protein ABDK00_015260 [Niabella insulamsoli]|uniref:hypothetical protein n=1 Tax=Niabella insulamsoli TaxID=3144874 RepID=UPI0031FC4F22
MRWLILLSRVAFLSGIAMLLAMGLNITSLADTQTTLAVIVLAGYGLAGIMLPLVNLTYLLLSAVNRRRLRSVPLWLLLCNVAFLLIFLIFTFYINDPYYNR